ncbi:cupin domain-containing protein [Piscinibacter sp.]|jgi:uncharacterized RmlC-like cupin family protein|uniref:cupin domain-containing protein n=1 Tax=Piscinibacter sp. TaxID=1903157 RepID=UPI00355A98A3
MTTRGFTVSHASDARFERGLRGYYEYRGLGIKEATDGGIDVHVIRAVPGEPFSSEPHVHRTTFQLVYVLKGWIELEYEEYGVQRFEAGSSVFQPPSIRHREVGHSDDVEMLEIVMPADFETALIDSLHG